MSRLRANQLQVGDVVSSMNGAGDEVTALDQRSIMDRAHSRKIGLILKNRKTGKVRHTHWGFHTIISVVQQRSNNESV
jgi:hypothetical protein